MRDNSFVNARPGEDDPVRPRVTASVWVIAVQDGEFVIGTRIGEAETLIIVVHMGISARAHPLALPEVVAALGHGFVDVRLVVARRATVINALTLQLGECDTSTDRQGSTDAFNGSDRIGNCDGSQGDKQPGLYQM